MEKRSVPSKDDNARQDIITTALNIWADSGKRGAVIIGSKSMSPLMRKGSRVRVAFGARPRFGDVVLYRRDGHLIAHRIVGRRGGHFVTKGDRALRLDPSSVDRGQIIATVIGVQRGRDFVDLETPRWRAVSVGLAVCSLTVGAIGEVIGRGIKLVSRRAG